MKDRPQLGDIKVGAEVFVIKPSYHDKGVEPIPARVEKAARVWLTIVAIDPPNGCTIGYEWRMRRDTQDDDNTKYSQHSVRFVTPEQLAWEQERNTAFELLRTQGISLHFDSPWRGREIELAKVLRDAGTT